MKLRKKALLMMALTVLCFCAFAACSGEEQSDTNVTSTPEVTEAPAGDESVEITTPTEEPAATDAPAPTEVPAATATPAPTEAPEATEAPTPTKAPEATEVPAPTETPVATEAPAPTEAPKPTATPVPTKAPEPTKAPAVSGPTDLTYDFNELLYQTSYGTQYTIETDGSISLQYEGLYQEIKLSLPKLIDMSHCLGVTVKMKSEAGNLAVKLYDKDFNEVFVRYDGQTTGVADHLLAPALTTEVAGIGLMACTEMEDYSNFVATVYSVTFHMDATYGGAGTEEPVEVSKTGALVNAAEKHNFSFGIVMNSRDLTNDKYKTLLGEECTSVSFGNEMKAYSLLNQTASKRSKDGMPVMNYNTADRMVQLAVQQGVKIRGHVLVWDAHMSDWFFREGYDSKGAYVDRETMLKRLEYYIDQVITHFEEKYPGTVYCWDVVNEAVGDGTGEYVYADKRHVRTKRNGEDNPFYTIIGDDYVELSFLYAKNTVEKLQAKNPDVEIALFYNDYSTFYDKKRDAICELVTSINSYAKDASGNYRKLCDGIGMQSYVGGYGTQNGCMNDSDITRIKTAVKKFHSLGVDVHVTELAVRNYDPAKADRHAEFYGDLFRAYAELNAEELMISNITVWGYNDRPSLPKTDYGYKQNGPYCGLFDENYEKKSSYHAVVEALK
ncbi:MAG: endo-1,4-beta-xylanase [Lachnospiraceae bacterium]|nr:endo-1,4-beta-xylanase [Lachnospiraceae bacterium]